MLTIATNLVADTHLELPNFRIHSMVVIIHFVKAIHVELPNKTSKLA